MRIVIDCRSLVNATLCGVVIYVQEIITALQKIDHKNEYILWWNAQRPHEILLPKIFAPNFHTLCTKWPNKICNLASWTGFPKYNRLLFSIGKIDLFFMPDPRPIALSKNIPLITTFHDTLPTIYPQMFSWRSRIFHKLIRHKKLAKKANYILTVSNYVRDCVVKEYKISPPKITTTLLAPADDLHPVTDEKILQQTREKYNLPSRFILSLSTLEPRKNLIALLRAFEKINDSKIYLVVAGDYNQKIFTQHNLTTNNPRIIFCGAIKKEDRAALFTLAEVFVMPSLEEGFGLPVIEAMACGTPVITSNRSSLPEVAGKASILIDPRNVPEIIDALQKVLQDKKLHILLSQKALKQAKKFNWEKTAQITLEVFKKSLEKI